ncbi:putative glutamate-rich protein 6B [Sesbania bispinosa]|nr:putative glutamate-rich protein 6B [Sesbania bispinosa]
MAFSLVLGDFERKVLVVFADYKKKVVWILAHVERKKVVPGYLLQILHCFGFLGCLPHSHLSQALEKEEEGIS